MNLNMSNHIKSVHDKMRIYCFWGYLNQILVYFSMGNFTTNLRTLRPYQDRPFASERPQDRSLQNPKTLYRLAKSTQEKMGGGANRVIANIIITKVVGWSAEGIAH